MAKQKSEYEPIGPLDLRHGPPLETREARRALRERLKGHVSSPAWLPTDGPLGEALADLREPHVERCRRADRAVAEYLEQGSAYAGEQAAHIEVLRAAVRQGEDAPADKRTPEPQRAAKLQALRERVEAEIVALAESVDRVVAELRRREDDLISELTAQLRPAENKRREAARLLAEAHSEEWSHYAASRWLLKACDDGSAFGGQPFALEADPPPRWSGEQVRRGLGRHRSERQPWNAGYEEARQREGASA